MNQPFNPDMNSIFRNIPGYLLIKNLDSSYITSNLIAATEFKVKHPEDLYGLNDYTVDHPLAEIGDFFVELDKKTISKEKSVFQGIFAFPFHGKITPVLFTKFLIKDHNQNNAGIYSHVEEYPNCGMHKAVKHLIHKDSPCHWIGNQKSAYCYYLNSNYEGLKLTRNQEMCLFLLLRNYSLSDIAFILNSSTEKVAAAFAVIMHQFECNNHRDLIEKAIAHQYFGVVPEGIVHMLSHTPQQLSELDITIVESNQSDNLSILSKREQQCAPLLIKGKSYKEIARILSISHRTVECHIASMKLKLSCRNKADLIAKLCTMTQL